MLRYHQVLSEILTSSETPLPTHLHVSRTGGCLNRVRGSMGRYRETLVSEGVAVYSVSLLYHQLLIPCCCGGVVGRRASILRMSCEGEHEDVCLAESIDLAGLQNVRDAFPFHPTVTAFKTRVETMIYPSLSLLFGSDPLKQVCLTQPP